MPTVKKKKPKTVSQLKKEADNVFSKYIRTLYSNFGLVSCVTCGVEKPIAEMQNGHYISRGYNHLRFDERNAHPQCVGCNVFRKGNYPAYARYMVRRYGAEILEELDEESKFLKQWKNYELTEVIETYKEKLAALTAETSSA